MRDLVLVLTSRCNLACSYCYQAGRPAIPDMTWDIARAALDLLLAPTAESATLVLSGGEPLLAMPLVRRCVAYARQYRPAGLLRIVASTNGTLLDGDLARLLAAHDVSLQVSFDGAAQDLRARGSASPVVEGLDRLRDLEPDWFRRHLRVAVTLTPENLPFLAASVEQLLGAGVPDITFGAVSEADWPPGAALEEELDRQLASVAAACARHPSEGGGMPVSLLRAPPPRPLPADGSAWCRAAAPESFAVDPSGAAWGCPVAASSMQRLSPAGRRISEALHAGDVRDGEIALRLAALPARAATVRDLTHRRGKRSALADCGSCPHLPFCSPCPLASARLPGAADPDLVPTVTCALTRASARARAALPWQPPLGGLLAELERISQLLGRTPGETPG